MRHFARRHPFLLVGLLTLTLFFISQIAQIERYPSFQSALGAILRVLIVPMYLVWLLVTALQVWLVGPADGANILRGIFGAARLVAGLIPYVLADAGLRKLSGDAES